MASGGFHGPPLVYKFLSLHLNKNTVIAFAELYMHQGNGPVEIYNVYTHPTFRRKKYALKLLNLIKTLYPGRQLWLGILGNHRSEMLARMYAKAGFTSEVKVVRSSALGKNHGFNFIQMKYKPGKASTSANVINKTVQKVREYVRMGSHPSSVHLPLVHTRFTIKGTYIQQVKSVSVNKNNATTTEHGGAIQFGYSGFKSNGNANRRATFTSENLVSRYLTGTGGVNHTHFSTQIPGTNAAQQYYITWHTHPIKCYRTSRSCVGLPSSQDLIAYIRRYMFGEDVTGINLIFSKEGMYIIRLSSKFMSEIARQRNLNGGPYIPPPNVIAALDEAFAGLQLPQFRPNLTNTQRNSVNLQNSIITTYKHALESVRTAQNNTGIKIFKMEFIRYPANPNGSISFNADFPITHGFRR